MLTELVKDTAPNLLCTVCNRSTAACVTSDALHVSAVVVYKVSAMQLQHLSWQQSLHSAKCSYGSRLWSRIHVSSPRDLSQTCCVTHRHDNKTAVVVRTASDNWLASLQKLVHKTLADFSRKATRGLLRILRSKSFSPDQARLGEALNG